MPWETAQVQILQWLIQTILLQVILLSIQIQHNLILRLLIITILLQPLIRLIIQQLKPIIQLSSRLKIPPTLSSSRMILQLSKTQQLVIQIRQLIRAPLRAALIKLLLKIILRPHKLSIKLKVVIQLKLLLIQLIKR